MEIHVGPGEWIRGEAGGTIEEGETMEDCLTKVADRLDRWLKTRISAMTDFYTGEQKFAPSVQAKEEADIQFEEFKEKIDSFVASNTSDEEISRWVKNNGWGFSVEAKNYIESIKKIKQQ